MTTEFNPQMNGSAYPELEHQELDQRLRSLSWPAAPAEVKDRCLQAVLQAAEGGGPAGSTAVADAPRGTNGNGPASRIGGIERVRRHELTRWEPTKRPVSWPAPRRQPRFAAVL
jgi:hypothetical protein